MKAEPIDRDEKLYSRRHGWGTRATWIMFLVLVIAKGSAYWIGSTILRPGEPLSVVVMYRGMDPQSFPIMANLAHGGIGEPGLYEGHNAGVLTERLFPWLIHSGLFRLFGSAGFVIADLLVTPLRFLLVAYFLRLCGVSSLVA